MGFKIKYTYPDGETEIEDEVYDTEQQAESAAKRWSARLRDWG